MADLFIATASIMVATALALTLSYAVERRIPIAANHSWDLRDFRGSNLGYNMRDLFKMFIADAFKLYSARS